MKKKTQPIEETTLIQCNHCEHRFLIGEATIGQQLAEGLAVNYFECPDCGYKYPYMLCDKTQLNYIRQLQAVQQEIEAKRKLGKQPSAAKLRQLNSLFDASKAHQAKLRNKHLQAVTTLLNQSGQTETNS